MPSSLRRIHIREKEMPRLQTPLDQPTRRTIEALFRELLQRKNDPDNPLDAKYDELRRQYDDLEEKLLDNPKLKRLKRLRNQAYGVSYRKNREFMEKVKALRNQYFAHGITKKLLNELDQLIK